ncbi:alpha/beta-hydrolase [Daldinia bambusicola]|nr:alpha/beta-hydrolase [Daldinia bambusicola]
MKPSRSILSWVLASAFGGGGTLVAAESPTVNLGYATYQGAYNESYNLNIWKSIRYATPPVGKLRWQAPRPPAWDNKQVTPAVDQPPLCPQTGAYGIPASYGFNSAPGDEDCLYLNVYAAPDASNLPVFVWIHGGGYGVLGAVYDPTELIKHNDNGLIVVEIQYRLGAFGFLSSAEVKEHGQVNAGLLDQRLALEWVQKHISQFGGDPSRVTIGGESAGGGSVLLHASAYGGKPTDLFQNIIAASPYLPPTYQYNGTVPTAHYDKFVELAGCSNASSTFDCLVAAESSVLQNASGTVSTTQGYYGSWAFVPSIDGDYVQQRPSVQLLEGKVTGKRLLVGNNANEGVLLTDPEVDSREKYDSFISTMFPLLTPEDVTSLNTAYEIDSLPSSSGIRYDTLGYTGPTALYQSGFATGIQQAVFNLGAESNFVCPAQWFAEAFSSDSRQAWKYQYSLTPSYHGADLNSYFAIDATWPSPGFKHAMRKIYGNFIINNTPVISVEDATAGESNATVPIGSDGNIQWPEFDLEGRIQMNLNTTGGTVTDTAIPPYLNFYIRDGPGIVNTLNLSDSYTWEGGRGRRCDFWRDVSARVPQ